MASNVLGPGPRWPGRIAAIPVLGRYLLLFALVVLAHATLLHLPYFWDEGGYYVPAALDFYRRGTLIPTFTNAHPPLPNVLLALVWRLFGFHIVVTRLAGCAFAAGGLLAVYALARSLLGGAPALAVAVLTGIYPIWFVQSSLVHADMLAAALTLGGLGLYLTAPQPTAPALEALGSRANTRRLTWTATFFCLAVLAKETALLQPVTLACLELWYAFQVQRAEHRSPHLRWAAALCTPIPVLGSWFAFHRLRTGFTFGNPTFLRYNATANFTAAHIGSSLGYRFLHLFWQRDLWVPIVLALACLWFPSRPGAKTKALPKRVLTSVAVLLVANWLAFSILGGALLTRYLLPMYPLTLLVCVWLWCTHTPYWPALAGLTGAAFVSALWLSPPTYFAPEDNLAYRDMILVHQEAITYLQRRDPDATVLTAWPATAELTRPELGYTALPFKVVSVEDLSRPEITKAAAHPTDFDTALVFSTQYLDPALQQYLLRHPASRRGRKYAAERQLFPAEVAALLGGTIVWEADRHGEWAAVLRFNRSYEANVRRDASLR